MPVTAFDLIGAADLRNESILTAFQNHYYSGVLPKPGFEWIRTVSIKLKKPCPFLNRQRCTIYEVRPLACILFPEYQAVNGTLDTLAAQSEYREYLCLRSPFSVSEERRRVIRNLEEMLQRELFISDSFLFGYSPLLIDFVSLMSDLKRNDWGLAEETNQGAADSTDPIPFEAFDRVFTRVLTDSLPGSPLDTRLALLEDHDQRKRIFAHINDAEKIDRQIRKMENRSYVFRYVDGKLKGRRRGLHPKEYMFMGG